ncbi:methionyl-tRNA formyltransferase [Candidatus Peregrinibacteria bacterium]|nr:methionyl-tRNA formyltransferase [Candidatus Peregrinibacteria bacterium]
MKVVFFGTPDFALPALEVLNQSEKFEVISVITQPDKKIGRSQILMPPPVKEHALNLGLKVFQPNNQAELKEYLKNFEADFYVVIAFGMILDEKILKMPKKACINVHASLLPKYRGASPIQESLLNGDKETGISIIKMNEKMDQGDILMIQRINIDEEDNTDTLRKKLAYLSGLLLPYVLEDYKMGHINPIPQNHEKATYCKKIKKEDAEIKKSMNAKKVINMIKAFTPWPNVYTFFKNKKMFILETKISTNAVPKGEFKKHDNKLYLGFGNNSLEITKLKLEGKKEMDAKAFLNGYGKKINSIN